MVAGEVSFGPMGEEHYRSVARQAMRVIRERVLGVPEKVEMARRLSEALGRSIGQADVGRWEKPGGRLPGADVLAAYLDMAYIDISEEGLLNPESEARRTAMEVLAMKRDIEMLKGETGSVVLTALQRKRLTGRPPLAGDRRQYIDIEAAAERKGVSRTTIDNWIDEGRLTGYADWPRKQLVVKIAELDAVDKRR